MEDKKKKITFPDEEIVDSSEIIRKLREDAEIPEVVMHKANLAFQKIQEEAFEQKLANTQEALVNPGSRTAKKRCLRKKKRSILIAVAAAAAVGTATVGAAAYMKWSRSLAEGMLVEPDMQRSLEESKMTVPVNKSCTVNGITVTAEQSIVDSHYAQVAFKVEGYDAAYDVMLDEQPFLAARSSWWMEWTLCAARWALPMAQVGTRG